MWMTKAGQVPPAPKKDLLLLGPRRVRHAVQQGPQQLPRRTKPDGKKCLYHDLTPPPKSKSLGSSLDVIRPSLPELPHSS